MANGAVWKQDQRPKKQRIRRAKSMAKIGDRFFIYYDESILNLQPPKASCLKDLEHYSIWHKPAGLMTQGTYFGDHCALSRQVEQNFHPKRRAFIVHRLDREVGGLVIIAHSSDAAARLSHLLRRRRIDKKYQVTVLGDIYNCQPSGTIELPLDGKIARTFFQVIKYDPQKNQSILDISIETGHRHQIRRHLDMIGFPVVGDPRYGKGNKNRAGIQLSAYAVAFQCPYGKGMIKVNIQPNDIDLDHDPLPVTRLP